MPNTRIHLLAAARPNFMKIAPLYHALKGEEWCDPVLIHTGQHYDANMSQVFWDDLQLPKPDIHLGVGSGTHAEQTAGVMVAYEKVCMEDPPDWVIVVGDVNATMAVAITAKKLHLKVAHLEAGLRSGDMDMPEEINRMVTDCLCDLLWTPSEDADANLLREGIAPEKVVRVGNIMMDSYALMRNKIERSSILDELALTSKTYAVVTLHRPSNVDEGEKLSSVVDVLVAVSARIRLVFPLHPRTKRMLRQHSLLHRLEENESILLLDPQPYVPFMALVSGSRLIITDSGGIQEEATYLNIPCLTLRENTERPITITQGSNLLVSVGTLEEKVIAVLEHGSTTSQIPDLWDGDTAGRVVASLRKALMV